MGRWMVKNGQKSVYVVFECPHTRKTVESLDENMEMTEVIQVIQKPSQKSRMDGIKKTNVDTDDNVCFELEKDLYNYSKN